MRFTLIIGGKKRAPNMTMIETVRQRQKNSTDFASCYDNLCALQNSCPLGSITANLDELTIDCNADRIRHSDWTPILNALKINKTLKIVAFRSYWQQTLYPDGGKITDEFCFVLSKPDTGFTNTGTVKLMDIKGADTKYPLYIGVSIIKG